MAVEETRTLNSPSSEMLSLTSAGVDIAPADTRTAREAINLQPDPANDGDRRAVGTKSLLPQVMA